MGPGFGEAISLFGYVIETAVPDTRYRIPLAENSGPSQWVLSWPAHWPLFKKKDWGEYKTDEERHSHGPSLLKFFETSAFIEPQWVLNGRKGMEGGFLFGAHTYTVFASAFPINGLVLEAGPSFGSMSGYWVGAGLVPNIETYIPVALMARYLNPFLRNPGIEFSLDVRFII